MARNWFGGQQVAVIEVDGVDGEDDLAQLVGGLTVTFWNLQAGGTQYTDLLDAANTATDHTTTSTGADGYGLGLVIPIQGPDEVWEMWASVNGGPRFHVDATNTGTRLGPLAIGTSQIVAAHISAPNPHQTRVQDLYDVDAAAAIAVVDGQLLGYSSADGAWLPVTIPGLSGTVQLTGAQTITGQKTMQPANAADSALRLIANASQTGALFFVGGTDGQETFRAGPDGQIRVVATSTADPALVVRGYPSQATYLQRWETSAGTILASVDELGRVRAPNISALPPVTVSGVLAVGASQALFYNDTGVDLTIRSVRASVSVAPTGAAIRVDINIAGTTIFTTQANRPSIAAGATTSGAVTAINVTTFPAGAALSIDVDVIGSGVPGSNLVVQLLAY